MENCKRCGHELLIDNQCPACGAVESLDRISKRIGVHNLQVKMNNLALENRYLFDSEEIKILEANRDILFNQALEWGLI